MLTHHVDSFEKLDYTDASPEQAPLPSTTAVSSKASVDSSSIADAADDDDFAMRSITVRAFDYVQVPLPLLAAQFRGCVAHKPLAVIG